MYRYIRELVRIPVWSLQTARRDAAAVPAPRSLLYAGLSSLIANLNYWSRFAVEIRNPPLLARMLIVDCGIVRYLSNGCVYMDNSLIAN